MPACVAAMISIRPLSPEAINVLRLPSSTALNGCLVVQSGLSGASSLVRASAKASCTYIGCSHQRVPSLSKVATRPDVSTKSGLPDVVTRETKFVIEALTSPLFQDGSGSVLACASNVAGRSGPITVGIAASAESRTRRLIVPFEFIDFIFPLGKGRERQLLDGGFRSFSIACS